MNVKLYIDNMGWSNERYQALDGELRDVVEKLEQYIKLKNPIIIHLYKDINKKNDIRAEYDEGIIIIYESTSDWRGDFIHEFAHQICRYDDLRSLTKIKLKDLKKKLQKNNGDGRIFINDHVYSEEKEILATLFKWYISGKIIDEAYETVLKNYCPEGYLIIEDILNKEKLQKSTGLYFFKAKKYPIGYISQKTGLKKVAEGKWVPVKEEQKIEKKLKEFNYYNLPRSGMFEENGVKYIGAFHGTSKKNKDKILKEGLLPSSETGIISGSVGQEDISLTDNFEFAESYGPDTILYIKIPLNDAENFDFKESKGYDIDDPSEYNFSKIPAQYIKGIYKKKLKKSLFFKSRNHKYVKRTGVKGNYKYWYKDPKTGKLTTNEKESIKIKKIDFGEYEVKFKDTTFHIERTDEKNTWDLYVTNKKEGNDHEWSKRFKTKKEIVDYVKDEIEDLKDENKKQFTLKEVENIMSEGVKSANIIFDSEKNDKFIKEKVNINDIESNLTYNDYIDDPDAEESLGIIHSLVDKIKNGIKLHPIVVDENNKIMDGLHRYIAYLYLNKNEIEVFKRINKKKLKKSKFQLRISDKNNFLKAKTLPIGTVRNWKGGKFKKVGNKTWKFVGEIKEKKSETKKEKFLLEQIPVKGLNKGIDFKANEKFLNDEIKEYSYKNSSIYQGHEKLYSHYKIQIADIKNAIKNKTYWHEDYSMKKIKGDELKRVLKNKEERLKERKQILHEMSHLEVLEDFAKNLTPVHSLSAEKFIRVLKSGGLKSLEQLGESGKQAGYAIVESEIRPEFGDEITEKIYKEINDVGKIAGTRANLVKFLGGNYDVKKGGRLAKILNKLYDNWEEIETGAIGYEVDKELGTNKHVFSILGPNGNGSGYGEISIILKPEIMEHPDFNMTPVAGTSFYSGEMYDHREWTKEKRGYKVGDEFQEDKYTFKIIKIDEGNDELEIKYINAKGKLGAGKKENIGKIYTESFRDFERMFNVELKQIIQPRQEDRNIHFNKSKLNAKENPKYYEYMAKDIAAQGSINDYLNRQSHGKYEGHLPSFVPTSMFAEVIIGNLGAERLMTELEDTDKKFADKMNQAKDYKEYIKILKSHLEKKGIKITVLENDTKILPYMEKSFKEGKWKKQK